MTRNYKIANLRALAIIVVVLGHSIILYSDAWNLMPTSVHCEIFNKTKWVIDRFQMELYFMISGYLMWFSVKKILPFIEFARKKALRLLIPYVAFGLCWMLPIKYALQIPTVQDFNIIQIIGRFFCGIDNGHLWFLYTLFLLMIVLYPLNKVARNMQFGGGILLIFSVLCPIGSVLVVPSIGNHLPFVNNALKYGMWFQIGLLLNAYEYKKIAPWLLCIVALNAILSRAALISLVIVGVTYILMPNKEFKWMSRIDKRSFGIYLLHSPLIYITFTLIPNVSPFMVVSANLLFAGVAYWLTGVIQNSRLNKWLTI